MQPLSVTIITLNEEKNIRRCLESVSWADEIIVVDSGSEDRTLDICREFGCKIIQIEWKGYGLTKQFAVEQAIHDWILNLDADEVVTDGLKNCIKRILNSNSTIVGYRVKRASFYLDKRIRYCGWQKDYKLRFFNRKFGSFDKSLVHEKVILNGDVKLLKYQIDHYPYPTLESHIIKLNRYALLGARQMFSQEKNIMLITCFLRGFAKFIKMYFLKLGILDGKYGFLLCLNSAFYVYLKYSQLWQMQQSKSSI